MVTHDRQTAGALLPALSGGLFYLLPNMAVCLSSPPRISFLSMGRRPWATSDQLTFLRSYIPELPKAKAGTGLNVLYVQVAQEFLTHWAAEPTTSHPTETELIALSTTYPELVAIPITPTVPLTPEQLDALAKIRLHSVRFAFAFVFNY